MDVEAASVAVTPPTMVVETFGPFVIPAVLFLVGVAFYAVVVLLGRLRRTETYHADE